MSTTPHLTELLEYWDTKRSGVLLNRDRDTQLRSMVKREMADAWDAGWRAYGDEQEPWENPYRRTPRGEKDGVK